MPLFVVCLLAQGFLVCRLAHVMMSHPTLFLQVYSFGVMLWQMCTGTQPFHGMHAAHILYGKQTSSLQLQWPSEVYSPIRKLGELCTAHEQLARPNFDQVCKALVQIELRMQRTRAEASGAGGASGSGRPGSTAAQQAGQQPEYNLMPDPDLLI